MGGKGKQRKKVGGTARSPGGRSDLLTPQLEEMPTNLKPAIQRSVDESMDQVFSNNLLRGMIVAQVIQNEIRSGHSRRDLRAVRLVSKSWLLDASKYLLQSGQPLFRLQLTRENSLNSSPQVQQNGGKLLDTFTRAMDSPTRVETETPPLSLRIRPDFFREENHQSFSNFLVQFATRLVELHIGIPRDGGSMSLTFPQNGLLFPHLRKFKIAFPPIQLSMRQVEKERSCSGCNFNALPFIQSILNGSENLRELHFPHMGDMVNCIPYDIRYLHLPPTITTLDVEGFDKSTHFEALFHFNLPHLRNLTFCMYDKPYAAGLLSRILEKFAASLRQFRICDTGNAPPTLPPHLFRFPLVENLKTLYFRCRYAELEEGHPPLQNSLPNLEKLGLTNQTKPMVQKWMEFSTFSKVNTLCLELTEPSPPLSTHFPGLQVLTLNFEEGVDFGYLSETFSGMCDLLELQLHVQDGVEFGRADEWDSFFSGIPVGLVGDLKADPKLWEIIRQGKLPTPSIRKMRKLKSLFLSCQIGTEADVEPESLISDLAFKFGFMQMPNLTELNFEGRFKASVEMARVWRDRGCFLNENCLYENDDEM